MSARRLAGLVLLLAGFAAPAIAQEPRAAVAASATEISVGDHLLFEVGIEHDADSRVVWPESIEAGPFELVDLRVAPVLVEGDRAHSTATLVLTAFELGELEIPGLRIPIIDGGGNEISVTTDAYGVVVSSIGLDDGGDIRDLKGPRSMARNWLLLWPWALALLLLGTAAWWLASRLGKRSEASAPTPPAAPARPAHEIAYEQLARLEASPLLDRGQVKEYYVRVAEILRAYLEGRYGIAALEMTSSEILAQLRSGDLERGLRDDFARFFEACDLVKFAKHRPVVEERAAIVPQGRRLVDATRPLATSVSDAAGRREPTTPSPDGPSLRTGEARV